jgi:hypothetical protein
MITRKAQLGKDATRIALFAMLTLALGSCTGEVERGRPPTVSPTAILIHAPKGSGVWQECRLDRGTVHCRISNRKGLVLYDEPFAVYSGQIPIQSADLEISDRGGEQWILLHNGTILIPTSDEAGMRRFLDWYFGKRPTR